MQKRNYIMFILLTVFSIIVTVSGFVLWLVLPRGQQGFRGGQSLLTPEAEFMSLSRDTWLSLHDWISVALIAIAVVHIVVHRRWIAYMTRKLFRAHHN